METKEATAVRGLRVGLYARVSTADKDQNPETQLMALREFAQAQDWCATEYVDYASAVDISGRRAWAALIKAAAQRKIDVILVWKLDRAFRSVLNMASTVEQLRRYGVALRSYTEPWIDTSGTMPAGDLMMNLLASFAQFERSLISERTKAGMARARATGVRLGRPRKAAAPAADEAAA
jgi:DNA invertase Pin-like site-specific DNA recombinase